MNHSPRLDCIKTIMIDQIRSRMGADTQGAFGKRVNLTQPRVSDLMNNRIEKFSMDTLVRIFDILSLPLVLNVDPIN